MHSRKIDTGRVTSQAGPGSLMSDTGEGRPTAPNLGRPPWIPEAPGRLGVPAEDAIWAEPKRHRQGAGRVVSGE